MKKTTLALTILLSLGVVGCSSNSTAGSLTDAGLSDATAENTKVAVDNSEIESASSYTSILTLTGQNELSEETTKEETVVPENPTESTDNAGNVSEEGDSNSITDTFASTYFAKNSHSATASYMSDHQKAVELLTQTGNIDLVNGTKAVDAEVSSNTVLLVKNNPSYSGYAVIREAYPETRDNDPVNSYVAVVKSATPASVDKALFLDATYTGSATFSSRNANTVTGYTKNSGDNVGITLNVKDEVVTGNIARLTGTKATLVTLNEAVIQQSSRGVTFQGDAVIHSSSGGMVLYKDEQGNFADVAGIYQGQFAGEKAQEIVGTFESLTTEKERSVQGAFLATCESGSCK